MSTNAILCQHPGRPQRVFCGQTAGIFPITIPHRSHQSAGRSRLFGSLKSAGSSPIVFSLLQAVQQVNLRQKHGLIQARVQLPQPQFVVDAVNMKAHSPGAQPKAVGSLPVREATANYSENPPLRLRQGIKSGQGFHHSFPLFVGEGTAGRDQQQSGTSVAPPSG